MTKSTLMSFLTGMVFFVMTWTTANAHVSHIEPQAARSAGVCEEDQSPEFCNPDTPDGSPEEDFSFEHPFVMAPTFYVDFFIHEDHHDGEEVDECPVDDPDCDHHDDDEEFVPGQGPNIEISKAIHAYLSPGKRDDDHDHDGDDDDDDDDDWDDDDDDWDDDHEVAGDVDWFKFVLDDEVSGGTREDPDDPDANNELGYGDRFPQGPFNPIFSGSALVSATALPWRCDAYKTSLPTIALIGPYTSVFDNRDDVSPLPEEVQEVLDDHPEWRIFVSEDHNPYPFPRGSSDFTAGINTEWWGGNPNTLFSGFDFRGGTAQQGAAGEGTYHIVVWDPNGEALDYTLSTGFWEQPTEREGIVGDANRLLFDNDMLLNSQCNDPCDGVEDNRRDFDEELLDISPGNDVCVPFPSLQQGICGCIRGV